MHEYLKDPPCNWYVRREDLWGCGCCCEHNRGYRNWISGRGQSGGALWYRGPFWLPLTRILCMPGVKIQFGPRGFLCLTHGWISILKRFFTFFHNDCLQVKKKLWMRVVSVVLYCVEEERKLTWHLVTININGTGTCVRWRTNSCFWFLLKSLNSLIIIKILP